MHEVTKRITVRTTIGHEVGRVFEDLGYDNHYVGTVTTRTHEVVQEETTFTDGLPAPQHVIVHVPDHREFIPLGPGPGGVIL